MRHSHYGSVRWRRRSIRFVSTTTTYVSVPAEADSVRIIRIVAADAAAISDLGFDRYSDLELAISEVSALLLTTKPETLECRLEHQPGEVNIWLEAGSAALTNLGDDELSLMVLDAVTDDFSTSLTGATPAVHFRIGSRSPTA